ncbi:carbohydrate ABC transporter permease [Anaerosporobacter sp.]|uniref:carbohydrate ABC transporter permease n=1 Tax=Anaerosporobacter sp. TaxID=1872529 RepID=UPI00286F8E75|nr:sugar ABC transporter permease [Anaerosporobacter sp.]
MNSNIYKKKRPVLVFLIPAFIFMAVFLYYPFIKNIMNSFQNISGLGTASKGFNEPWYTNYKTMFEDPNMRIAIKNTVFMILATLVGQVGIALILALLVDNIGRGKKFFQTVYFLPIVISATALGLLFNLIFLYDKGMLNQLLEKLGASGLIDWKDPKHAMITMLIPVMWQYVGFYFVILITGLNNISEELYEAAVVDGATKLQQVRYISIPLVRNVVCTCTVLAVTGALKVFDLPWIMFPKGMPVNTTWLTGTYMYYQTFNANNVDYGSAIAVVIVVLGIILSKVANRVFKEKEY